jgi:flagellar basal-body rod protein FlgC
MIDPLRSAIHVAASGLQAQSHRARIVSENLANHDSTGSTPGANPYTRKIITFGSDLDNAFDATMVRVERIAPDPAPYPLRYEPGHPAANAQGYVKHPNVSMLVEIADIREANRSYEANLQVVRQARAMIGMTIDLLRSNG